MMLCVLGLAAWISLAADDGNRPTAEQVVTVVHMTLQALSSNGAVAVTNASAAEAPANILSHSLYFLSKDDGWISQV